VTALALALALAVAPAPAALQAVADQVAAQGVANLPAGPKLGVWVQASTPELAQAAASALIDALHARGARAALPIDAADGGQAETQARAAGLDALLRIRVGVDGTWLTAAGDRIGTWVNLWDGATPNRQGQSAALAARTPADPTALALARVPAPAPAPPELELEALFRVPAPVLALALVDADGDGRPEIAALTPSALLILRVDGAVLAQRELSGLPRRAHPVRAPCGGLVSPDGPRGHRLLYATASQARGEAVQLDATGVHSTGLLDGVPLCLGPQGAVMAQSQGGTNVFGPEVMLGSARAALPRPVYALSAAGPPDSPQGLAFLAQYPDGTAQLLDPHLAPQGPALPAGVSALADLGGTGAWDQVLSGPGPRGALDAVRVVAPGMTAPLFQAAVPGAITAMAAGDLYGTGRQVALLAALQPGGDTAISAVEVKP